MKYDIVWCGMAWHGMAWDGMACMDVLMVRYGDVWWRDVMSIFGSVSSCKFGCCAESVWRLRRWLQMEALWTSSPTNSAALEASDILLLGLLGVGQLTDPSQPNSKVCVKCANFQKTSGNHRNLWEPVKPKNLNGTVLTPRPPGAWAEGGEGGPRRRPCFLYLSVLFFSDFRPLTELTEARMNEWRRALHSPILCPYESLDVTSPVRTYKKQIEAGEVLKQFSQEMTWRSHSELKRILRLLLSELL